jgi:hypothetical protein
MDKDMTIGIVRRTARRRNNFKLPAVERMGGIGYLEDRVAIARTIRVVEGGINIGNRLTIRLRADVRSGPSIRRCAKTQEFVCHRRGRWRQECHRA